MRILGVALRTGDDFTAKVVSVKKRYFKSKQSGLHKCYEYKKKTVWLARKIERLSQIVTHITSLQQPNAQIQI